MLLNLGVAPLLRHAAEAHEREIGKLKKELNALRQKLGDVVAACAEVDAPVENPCPSPPVGRPASTALETKPSPCPPAPRVISPPATQRVSEEPSKKTCGGPVPEESDPKLGVKAGGSVEVSNLNDEAKPHEVVLSGLETAQQRSEVKMRHILQQWEAMKDAKDAKDANDANDVKDVKDVKEKDVNPDNVTGGNSPTPILNCFSKLEKQQTASPVRGASPICLTKLERPGPGTASPVRTASPISSTATYRIDGGGQVGTPSARSAVGWMKQQPVSKLVQASACRDTGAMLAYEEAFRPPSEMNSAGGLPCGSPRNPPRASGGPLPQPAAALSPHGVDVKYGPVAQLDCSRRAELRSASSRGLLDPATTS